MKADPFPIWLQGHRKTKWIERNLSSMFLRAVDEKEILEIVKM